MITPQQAYRLFIYADWAMLTGGLAAIGASVGWGLYAILPRNKGRRRRVLLRALMSFLVFAMFWGMQASVTVAFFHEQWTPLLIVLFALPVVVMLVGLIASIAYAARATLPRTRKERKRMLLKSLVGVFVFGVGVAPHTAALLMPIISAEDHSNLLGTLTRVGEPAPGFDLVTIDGTPFHTADLRGQVIVLNFFATWCGPCQQELPQLQAIWNEFRNQGHFTMLVVGREETDESVKAFQQEHGFTFPMASDRDASIYAKFASQSPAHW
jgi:peroxiredoxin/uncharacterized integral membrane protein